MDDAGHGRRGLKPTLTVAIQRAVAKTWGCDVGDAIPIGGSTGLNLLAGIEGREVVVRVHRSHVTAARVEALQCAREGAASSGVPVACAIRGRGDERCISVDSCVIEIEEYVASDSKMDSLPRIGAAMPMFARLHDALDGVNLPTAADDATFTNYLAACETTTRTVRGVRRIRTLNANLQLIAAAAEELAHDLEAITAQTFDALPVQWCHGDFWDNNVLFRGDEVVLVADFGFMGRRPRVDDLALTLYFTLWELVATGHRESLDALAELVASYDAGSTRPLSDAERDALPLALARQPLWSIGVWAAELDDPDAVAAHLRGHELALTIGHDILGGLDRWREALRR